MGGPIDIEQQGWVSVIHGHGRDLLMTKVMCTDLPNSDRGYFRCRRVVDSSSYIMRYMQIRMHKEN